MASVNRFGSELGLIHEVTILGRKVGADRAFWKALSQDKTMFRRVVEMVKSASSDMALKPNAETENGFSVTVDYFLDLDEAISAGMYDHIKSDITSESFPANCVPADGEPMEIEIRLVHLGRQATTVEVLAELDKRGLRPATLPELLALGAAHPGLQRMFWIVALGSGWRGPSGRVGRPILVADDGERELDLIWDAPDYRWYAVSRFAAVRK